MLMARSQGTSVRVFLAGCAVLCLTLVSRAGEPSPWLEVHSTHFTVITDAGEKKGKEVALRFEQMRAVFATLLMKDRLNQTVPLTILAFRNDKTYYQSAPLRQGQPIGVPGFFVPGEDQNFIVLNLFEEESWRAVAHDFAHLLLNYNYPRRRDGSTKAWPNTSAPFASTIRSMRSAATPNCIPASPKICWRTSTKFAIRRSRSQSCSAVRSGYQCPTCSP